MPALRRVVCRDSRDGCPEGRRGGGAGGAARGAGVGGGVGKVPGGGAKSFREGCGVCGAAEETLGAVGEVRGAEGWALSRQKRPVLTVP